MNDELVGIKVAKLAKEKGFNEKCKFRFFEGKGELEEQVTSDRKSFRVMEVSLTHFREMEIHYTLRPTQSLLSRWLREVHNIVTEVLVFNKGFLEKDKFCYQWRVYDKSEEWFTGLEYKTYELALEDCLLEALKLLK